MTDEMRAQMEAVQGMEPVRVRASSNDGRIGECHVCGQRCLLFDDLECGQCKDASYLGKWQDYARTLHALTLDLAAALTDAEARLLEVIGFGDYLDTWFETERYSRRGCRHCGGEFDDYGKGDLRGEHDADCPIRAACNPVRP